LCRCILSDTKDTAGDVDSCPHFQPERKNALPASEDGIYFINARVLTAINTKRYGKIRVPMDEIAYTHPSPVLSILRALSGPLIPLAKCLLRYTYDIQRISRARSAESHSRLPDSLNFICSIHSTSQHTISPRCDILTPFCDPQGDCNYKSHYPDLVKEYYDCHFLISMIPSSCESLGPIRIPIIVINEHNTVTRQHTYLKENVYLCAKSMLN
jgi:hypothetical protein